MAPPAAAVENALPAELSDTQYPDATPIPPPATDVLIATDPDCGKESTDGHLYVADCGVVITYRDRTLRADHIEYNRDTGDVDMTGHVVVTIGETSERVEASHGTINLQTQTGRFFDVVGSVGSTRKVAAQQGTGNREQGTGKEAAGTQRYTNGNPFLFTGRMVVKTGPRRYQVYGGTITSCQLPDPDWLLSAAKFDVNDTQAHTANSVFHLMGLPVLWFPYVTHPLDANDRQTGILIPEIGINSASKGDTVGEQIYWAINRSTDLTVGTIFYSARGWEQTASLRYRGPGQDLVKLHYSGLHDRGYYPGGVYVNQSGTDVTFSGRYDLTAGEDPAGAVSPVQARAVADVEYLSSFPYREAFSTNFNQAVSSDVLSTIYATREQDGMAASLEGDRYQGEKRIATTVPFQAEEQVHIFHAPALEFTTTDHELGSTGLEWNLDSSAAALKRTQPGFATGGMIERLDVRPELAYPLHFGGWNLRPSVAGRETFYSRSRFPPQPGVPGPVENLATMNRAAVDMELDLRAPVLERTFDSGWIRKLVRHDVKHTIAPEVTYRYINGINDFQDVLRFDLVDIASNTNEVEYGVTQRLFLREKGDKPCRAAGAGADATEILGSAGHAADAVEDPGEAANRDDSGEPGGAEVFFRPNLRRRGDDGPARDSGHYAGLFGNLVHDPAARHLADPFAAAGAHVGEDRCGVGLRLRHLLGVVRQQRGDGCDRLQPEVHGQQPVCGRARGLYLRGYDHWPAECAGAVVCGGHVVVGGELHPDARMVRLRQAEQTGLQRGGERGHRPGSGHGAVWRDPELVQLELLRRERGVPQVRTGHGA